MAWAVRFKSEFGQFFPEGDFPEFRERLRTYFTQEMSAEERAVFGHEVDYVGWVFGKFVKEIGILHPGDRTVLTALLDHEWPRAFQAERKIRSLGSLFKTTNKLLAVDQAMKDLIEGLEPGIHQFRPTTFLQPDSAAFPGSYFTMVIGQFRDSFIPDLDTEGDLWKRMSYLDTNRVRIFTGTYLFSASTAERYARLSLSSAATEGAHLWRERNLRGPDFFISDALHDAVKKAKLQIPQNFKVREA
jgi:hypothetical protein